MVSYQRHPAILLSQVAQADRVHPCHGAFFFQLMGVQEFHPEIAVITNLMPTHIDYHGSFEYVAAK